MEVLLLFVALLQELVSSTLYGPRFLTGTVGGSVTHQCFYSITPANKHDRKYWCKRASDGVCYTIVSTTGYVSKGHLGRVSLKDIPENGTFMVTMTQLESSDTGTYRCGIGSTNQDLYVSLNLMVSEDLGTPRLAELLHGELRGSVTIPCPPGDTRNGTKRFWCKVGSTGCTLIADTNGYVVKSYEGRIFITPQDSSGAFKVLINDLRKEDAGLYRCGTGSLGSRDSPWDVALQVTTASSRPRRPKFLSGAVGGSLSVRCHHNPQGSYEAKYLCRWKAASCSLLVDLDGFVHESYEGRIRIASSDEEKGMYTVVMGPLREDDAGWYWCGARSGHTEHTSAVKLLIQKGTCTSQNPETYTLVNPILPSSLAAYSMPTQRNTAGTRYTVGTTYTTGTKYAAGTMGTTGTSIQLPTASPGTLVTSRSSIYHESSSGESHLLPVVLSALLLLIFITIAILVLTKIKLQKKTGQERSTLGHAEAVLVQAGLNPAKEQMEETGTNSCKTDSSKRRIIYAILGRFRRTSLCGSYEEKNTFQQN
ncbi:polymeric immunoglobulin receptor-like [Cygnus olor]|uniref:polymeric immunoglobulin receptor-like n=1 Tax=Cygnus olor TaxID=8869 RepID=UPI001ADEB520|nr:polymeric immunoglobulin receptor-like [Cygnus olor]